MSSADSDSNDEPVKKVARTEQSTLLASSNPRSQISVHQGHIPGSPPASEVPAFYSQESLEKAVTDWLMEHQLKDGNVFAATVMDQKQLNDIQSYLDKPKMTRPVIGGVPLKLSGSVEHEVHRHVHERETSGLGAANRTSLLCNSGIAGLGRQHCCSKQRLRACESLKTMVDEHVKTRGIEEADNDELRPLGFYVTFKAGSTPIAVDDSEYSQKATSFPILTAIALRMVYSVVVPSTMTVVELEKFKHFEKFSRIIAAHCDLDSDAENFANHLSFCQRRIMFW
ncbi:multi-copy leucine-rich repeat protein, putative [Bodo saltans]|uniref:Multi-copy leucine-rich repeat protein, putative n=1 Tax=Bodo saltans TaxID=75058 RepID=A0A0S4JH26_BODSA|nr:multi-copy leucine-rich repeat protein, putative [Bodo saltans]|eukprot:CUG87709.1 multi-copy leucine-rich repeat protein, putative [Bodo saltans]